MKTSHSYIIQLLFQLSFTTSSCHRQDKYIDDAAHGLSIWKLWLSKCITWLSFSKSMTPHMKSLNCSKIFYAKIAFVKNKANYAKYQSIPIYCLQIVCIFPGEMMVINGIWLRVRNCTVFAMLWDESLTRVNLKIVHNKCPL